MATVTGRPWLEIGRSTLGPPGTTPQQIGGLLGRSRSARLRGVGPVGRSDWVEAPGGSGPESAERGFSVEPDSDRQARSCAASLLATPRPPGGPFPCQPQHRENFGSV